MNPTSSSARSAVLGALLSIAGTGCVGTCNVLELARQGGIPYREIAKIYPLEDGSAMFLIQAHSTPTRLGQTVVVNVDRCEVVRSEGAVSGRYAVAR